MPTDTNSSKASSCKLDTTSGDVGKAAPVARPASPVAAELRLDALLDLLPVGVFTIGPDMRVRVINGEAARLTGIDPRTAIGKSCEDLFHCTYCSPLCAAREAAQCGETRRDGSVELHRADGAPISVTIDAAPIGGGEIAVMLRDVSEYERMRRALGERWVFHGLVGVSAPMKDVVRRIRDMAPQDSAVLLVGEPGTGRDLAARAIHAESPRADEPFVVVDCTAYSDILLESELFGHARGYDGADRERAGRIEAAEGGTVFLREISRLSASAQARLLRVLDAHEAERLGEKKARPVRVRIVAATSDDLAKAVREGRFREELYHRLNASTIPLPPLRDRREDMAALVDHLLRRSCLRAGRDVPQLADDAMDAIVAYAWPGNVRELEDALATAATRAHEGVIHAADFPAGVMDHPAGEPGGQDERMRAALHRAAGSVTLAARLLGVHRTTLWRWMQDRGVDRADFRPQ